jgi:hypothetical protein
MSIKCTDFFHAAFFGDFLILLSLSRNRLIFFIADSGCPDTDGCAATQLNGNAKVSRNTATTDVLGNTLPDAVVIICPRVQYSMHSASGMPPLKNLKMLLKNSVDDMTI